MKRPGAAAGTAAGDVLRELSVPPLPRSTASPRTSHVGFYGAIAEWFDANLVADLAELRPAWKFELIGSTFTGDVSRLKNCQRPASAKSPTSNCRG